MPLLKTSEEHASRADESGPFWNPDTKAGLAMGAAMGAVAPSISNAVFSKFMELDSGTDAKKLRNMLGGMSVNDFIELLRERKFDDVSSMVEFESMIAAKTFPKRLAAKASWAIPAMLTAGASRAYYEHMRGKDGDGDHSLWGDVSRDVDSCALWGGANAAVLPHVIMHEKGKWHSLYRDPADVYKMIFSGDGGERDRALAEAWRNDSAAKRALKTAFNLGKYAVPGAALGGLSMMAHNAVHHGLRGLFEENEK